MKNIVKIIFSFGLVLIFCFLCASCDYIEEIPEEPIEESQETQETTEAVHVCVGDEWIIVSEPTCATLGEKQLICSCGEILATEDISQLPHIESTFLGREATCVEDGVSDRVICGVCGVVLLEQTIIPAKGHVEVIDEEVLPTCENFGLTEGRHCAVCDYVIVGQSELPMLLHDYVERTCRGCGLTDPAYYIELNSAEDIYALGRLFLSDADKNTFLGAGYNIYSDIRRFDYPDGVASVEAKFDYLVSATYKLTDDIVLTIGDDSGIDYFMGIGSSQYPFKGIFYGDEKKISLLSKGRITIDSNMNKSIGLFGNIENAEIFGVNVIIAEDIVVERAARPIKIGGLVGYAGNSNIVNCSVTISETSIGVDFAESETQVNQVSIGGLVGECTLSVIQNCTVNMVDGSVFAKGYDVDTSVSYANFSVGGILGFSDPGSDNTDYIGRIGNRLLYCDVISVNSQQQDVVFASLKLGDEVTSGGLVGCTFNNFVAVGCSVEISNGNIVAQKTADRDESLYGTQTGGIIGRLEHTGMLYGCSVWGDHLNIVSRSAENDSTAGGIVGWDMGPYHRNVISLNKCTFVGNQTSRIVLEILADDSVDFFNSSGGIVGKGVYRIVSCSASGVTIENRSVGVKRAYAGGICGIYGKYNGFWRMGTYFSADPCEIYNCMTDNIIFDLSENVTMGEIYAVLE